MPDTETDVELLARAWDGDRSAFDRITERHYRPVCVYARILTGDAAMAEDVAQEVFLRAWKAIRSITDPMALAAWLHATARNCARESRRDVRRFQGAFQAEDAPVAQVKTDERQDRLMEIVSALPDEMRVVLTLKYVEGITCEEMSRRLGRPIGTVTSLLARAYHEIRTRMKP